uniref:Histone deacetylase domain-containing protein n=1 Tax=Cannabis sativa TaxID=3483 RepID=A0A803PXQ3_CANSA
MAASVSSPQSGSGNLHVFWHEGMLAHDTGNGVFDSGIDPGFLDVLEKHPENSERVKNMLSILRRGPISPYITWHSGKPALTSELLSFHSIAMKYVLDGHGKLAYALVRPPGHHAQPTQADGYCFLNNAGLAVNLALNSGCAKVAVIDIDVHYGNGTAEGFYRSDKVLTISLHMNHGSWGSSHPQNGSIDELGEGKGYGYNLNIPLPNGTGDRGYEYAFSELVVPAIQNFEPDMMVLVVGQDSSAFDPNGRQCLTMEGFREIGKKVHSLANRYSGGRILVVQEGGYHVTYSAYCLHATLEGVLNLPISLLSDPIAYYPEDEAFPVEVIKSIKKYQTDKVPFMKQAEF